MWLAGRSEKIVPWWTFQATRQPGLWDHLTWPNADLLGFALVGPFFRHPKR